jgi:hypothetical protein
MPSSLSTSLAVDHENVPTSSMPTRPTTSLGAVRPFEDEGHNPPRIARRRGIESSEKLGRYRWAVERTLSWVNRFRRLKVRYERREDIHQAFLDLGCALICWRYVERLC